jgi:hypothetical protein
MAPHEEKGRSRGSGKAWRSKRRAKKKLKKEKCFLTRQVLSRRYPDRLSIGYPPMYCGHGPPIIN